MLEPNQMFAGRYRIVKHLADGGMGAVFEAEHVGTEARVALKLLWPHVVQVAAARKRFELEAKVAARVNSEHIVKVLDAGVDPESRSPYLVMELLAGATLAARVSRQGPLLPNTALTLMRQVAEGLDAAHGYTSPDGAPQPIVHRDLKPENLFLTQTADGSLRVKILDFGIAKVLSEATSVSQEVRGTPLYMSFEQVAGEALSPQTDVWALGLITYFALTGRRYWPAANKPNAGIQALFAEILSLPLPPPSQRIREDGLELRLPLAFDTWLLRCLDRNPARRFASAGQAIEALQLALALGGGAPTLPPRNEPPAIGRFAVRRLSTTASYDAEMFSAVRLPASSAASPEAASSPSLPAVAAEHTRTPRGRRRQALAILAAAGVGVLAAAAVVALRQPSNERELTTVVTAQEPAPEDLPPQDELPRPKPLEPSEAPASPAPAESEPNPPSQREPVRVPPPSQREPVRSKVLPDKSTRPKEPKGPDAPCASFDPYTGRCVRGEAGAR